MNRRLFRALVLSGALLVPWTFPVHAQTAAPWTPAPLFARAQITQTTLPNGVRAVVKSTPNSADLVSIQVWVRGGSRAEKPGEEGLAHLLEVAAVSASKNQPYSDGDDGGLNGAIRVVGGESGSLTSRDSTFYSATVNAADWGRALNALADSVLRPDLSPPAITRAKLLVANELIGQTFSAAAQVSDLAYQTAFPKHPYGHSTVGSEDTLGAFNAARARAFYDRQYVGKNISVVIVGQVPAAEAAAAVGRAFAEASAKNPVAIDPVAGPLPAKREADQKAPVQSEALALAWRSPGIKDPKDVAAMDTLLALWREGADANLRRLLMRDGPDGALKPLVASYDVDYLTQRDSGLVLVTLAGVEDRDATVKTVEDEVKRLQTQGPTPAELERARELLRRQYIEQSEGPAGQAGALGFYEMIDTYQFAIDYPALTAAVTASDIQRIAGQYLAPAKEIRAEIEPLPRPLPGNPQNPDDADGGGAITASWNRQERGGADASFQSSGLLRNKDWKRASAPLALASFQLSRSQQPDWKREQAPLTAEVAN